MLERIQAISDPTRFAILCMLRDLEMPAGMIALEFPNMTRPAISQHLQILKKNKLLWERREGTKRLYRLRRKGIADIYQFLEEFWDPKMAKLKSLADEKEEAA